MLDGKRKLVVEEYSENALEVLPGKRHCESQAETIVDASSLAWPDLYMSILTSDQRSSSFASSTSWPLDQPHTNPQNLTLATSTIIAEVGSSIDAWARDTIAFSSNQTTRSPKNDTFAYRFDAPSRDIKCFGMIHATSARLVGDMQALGLKLKSLEPKQTTFGTSVELSDQLVFLVGKDGMRIAQLNDSLAQAVCELLDAADVHLEAFVNTKTALGCLSRASRQHDSVFKVDINVYGTDSARECAGRLLSNHKLYLQHTSHRINDFEYDNPHMLTFGDVVIHDEAPLDLQEKVANFSMPTVHRIILDVCNGETDDRGLSNLSHSVSIKTKLLPHQDQALAFMVQQEHGRMPSSFQLWQEETTEERTGFRHKVTGQWTKATPPETNCGVLADDMGMGKSLSSLSLIIQKLPEASRWASSLPNTHHAEVRARATLIIVSSMLIMNGWFKEVEKHLDGSLKVIKYHGKARQNQLATLTNCDIVLTTYHTLAIEHKKGRSPIKAIKWYRIVLDEAHTIKRPATTLFKAVAELEACYRWCLTGTPIQNTLTDLGSLLSFLRVAPFDKPSVFRKYIVAQFTDNLEEATRSLKMLLNSVCLRRSISRLSLPCMSEVVRRVQLSGDERSQYNGTLEAMVRAAAYQSREQYCDTPFGKFQIQLQLRILCNHGTFQHATVHGELDEQTKQEDVACSFGVDGEVLCTYCHEIMPAVKTSQIAVARRKPRERIICNECTFQAGESHTEPVNTPIESQGQDRCQAKRDFTTQHPPNPHIRFVKAGFNPTGHSTKIKMLIEDLQVGIESVKSIVFSCWTRTLNLVALHLDRLRISYARIDGNTVLARRQPILDGFARHEGVRVLLMTTGTGAYGLNLTVANRVFILEPQWNPSIETQAIARVQRFPQTKPVQVVRYVAQKTVEEDIQRQQVSKSKLANRGFE